MSPFIDIASADNEGARVISVRGELDLYPAPDLRTRLLSAVEDGQDEIVLDLRETTFMDSTALGVIIAALRALQERGGRLVLVNERRSIAKTLAITGLDRVLPVTADLDSALERVRVEA